ncbi:MAG: DegT/DnrJ/EryC1/StrS family aminotransferase [Bacteroidota bacterium]
MGGNELKYVEEAFRSNWIAPVGPHLDLFEQKLGEMAGVDHVLATSSGTAAIHLALLVLGVKAGDEVICSDLTFVGSCNPILYCGATPVFIDSEPVTWNMDPVLLAEAIEGRKAKTGRVPKAIIVVHLYGMPARMDEIMAIARAHGIPVIEDAAEAVGSRYKGRACGSIGDLGVYSFNGNKIITTSGGGALLSNNGEWIKKARFLATQAREPVPHYEHKEVGYNYRLSNICAAIGLGQLEVLDQRVRERREIHEAYRAAFPDFGFQEEPEGFFSNRWLTAVLLPEGMKPEEIVEEMESENIEVRRVWKPMGLQPALKCETGYEAHVSSNLFCCGVCLPIKIASIDVHRFLKAFNQNSLIV